MAKGSEASRNRTLSVKIRRYVSSQQVTIYQTFHEYVLSGYHADTPITIKAEAIP